MVAWEPGVWRGLFIRETGCAVADLPRVAGLGVVAASCILLAACGPTATEDPDHPDVRYLREKVLPALTAWEAGDAPRIGAAQLDPENRFDGFCTLNGYGSMREIDAASGRVISRRITDFGTVLNETSRGLIALKRDVAVGIAIGTTPGLIESKLTGSCADKAAAVFIRDVDSLGTSVFLKAEERR